MAGGRSAGPSEAVLDTSIWMAIFNGEPAAQRVEEAVGDLRSVATPVILAELAANHELGRVRAQDPVGQLEARSRVEPFTREDALAGAVVYARVRSRSKSKVSLADALAYATAQRIGALYVTLDADLAGEPGVVVVPRA